MQLAEYTDILNDNEKAILKTLIYYDVFRHPLTKEELMEACNCDTTRECLDKSLEKLLKENLIYVDDNYFFLNKQRDYVLDRKSEKKKLDNYLRKARFMSRLIAGFPFVEGIMLSGSLSKYRIDEKGDIDYFIVTRPGRLWLTRTLLVLFKKLFLFNSYRLFCLNYFVDTNSLHFEDKNRYSATEVVTLIPTYNYKIYEAVIGENSWTRSYFPNFSLRNRLMLIKDRKRRFKKVLEFLLNNRMGDFLDDRFMKLTQAHRRKKFSHLSEERFCHAFTATKNRSTHHPDDYHYSAMDSYKRKISEFEKKYGIVIGLAD